MPVKERIAKDRLLVFSTEAVELFAELERTPGGHLPYTEGSRRLARMLGLTNEWGVSCHVSDRSSRSGYPPGHLTDTAFWRVREVRKALLAVCAQRADEPKAEAAQTQATERAQELEAAAVSPAEPTEAPGEPPIGLPKARRRYLLRRP
jgi:hypothetical protein